MKSLFLSLTLVLFGSFGHAQTTFPDFSDMTTEESAAFGAAVRAYLLENPQVIMDAVAVLEQREAAAATQSDVSLVQTYAEDLFFDGFSHVTGNPDGSILMVEFQDYKCGYCKRAHAEIQELILTNDDIRLVVKEFPILGAESVLSSRAAVAVLVNEGDDVYAVMSDLLMRFNGPMNEVTLSEMAVEAGADPEQMLAMMNQPVVTQVLQANRLLGQQMQISGTPTFVLGGQMLRGYVPLAQMQILVDDLRASLN
ncbi:MAG: thioredoxin domain-containing protein [Rhodobacteraceae bacterium]|nr:thioredoxin domain-containing protein [Paracoccaceae bacterium]